MAKKFLIGIAILIGLVIVGGALFQRYSMEIMAFVLVPGEPFSQDAVPPAPNYADASGWAVRGQGGGTTAIFYVHPTSYWSSDNWNGAVDDKTARKRLDDLFLKGQASAFAPYGVLSAPLYRQVTLGGFMAADENFLKALGVAYGDIRTAFAAFLEREPNRPIILAGHSQGSLHLLMLLNDPIFESARSRLVVAYLIGWPISAAADLPAQTPLCTMPDQTGCALTWQTFGPDADPESIVSVYAATPGLANPQADKGPMACINPLTFDAGMPSANSSAHKGGVVITGAGKPLGAPVTQAVAATCRADGVLQLAATPPDGFNQLVLPGDNYHMQDIPLFYKDLQDNIALRLATFEAQ